MASEMVERIIDILVEFPSDKYPTCDGAARAIIAAMREPSDEMIAYAQRHWVGDGKLPPCTDGVIGAIFSAMIDQALK